LVPAGNQSGFVPTFSLSLPVMEVSEYPDEDFTTRQGTVLSDAEISSNFMIFQNTAEVFHFVIETQNPTVKFCIPVRIEICLRNRLLNTLA